MPHSVLACDSAAKLGYTPLTHSGWPFSLGGASPACKLLEAHMASPNNSVVRAAAKRLSATGAISS